MARSRAGYGAWMGHDKEPPSRFGPRAGGRSPLVHSHSARPKRKILAKRGGKRAL